MKDGYEMEWHVTDETNCERDDGNFLSLAFINATLITLLYTFPLRPEFPQRSSVVRANPEVLARTETLLFGQSGWMLWGVQ
jgi:hypothetical protein